MEYLARRARAAREARDLVILNREAESLNREMEDVLGCPGRRCEARRSLSVRHPGHGDPAPPPGVRGGQPAGPHRFRLLRRWSVRRSIPGATASATQVEVGIEEGLKHESSVHCDALVSLPKPQLTDFVARLKPARLAALDQALRVALALGLRILP